MILLLTVIAVAGFLIICYQDFRYRAVFWFLFPLLAIILGIIHYLQVEMTLFYGSLAMNFILVSVVLLVLYFYSRIIAKKEFMNHSLGLGDILFFFVMGTGFPTTTFIILFTYAIFFSLLTFLVLKPRMKVKTVPLAGLMSLFLIVVLSINLCNYFPSIYTL